MSDPEAALRAALKPLEWTDGDHAGCFCGITEDQIVAVVAPLLTPRAWQPMDLAPKDGTVVLACVHHSDPYYAWSNNGKQGCAFAPMAVYWGTYHPNAPGEGEWRDGNGHKRPHLTHWMPLPPAPKERQG